MRLAELWKNAWGDLPAGVADLHVGGLCADSRCVKSGDVFFAVPGHRENGVRYVNDAVTAGAAVIIHDARERVTNANIPHIAVQDVRHVLACMAAIYHGDPSRRFYLAGVTGTNGKTTLTYLLEQVWQPVKTGVIGTVNTRYPGKVIEASHTTPDPILLQSLFRDMGNAGVEKVAMEASSHAVDQKRVEACHFDACLFTNLTQDHLDYHRDMETYFNAKKRLFSEVLRNSSKKSKLAVINTDDVYGMRLAREIHDADIRVTTFSAKGNDADLVLKSASYGFSGTRIALSYRGTERELETNLIGAHNVQNIMAVLLHELERGCDHAVLARKFSNVNVPGRLERVAGRNFFVDYAHTPDALLNVIEALNRVRRSSQRSGRLITVFGCGGDRDRTKRPLMGGIAARHSDVALVTSDNPRTEDPEKIIQDVVAGVEGVAPLYDGARGYLVETDRAKALERAVALAGPDDIVLVAGKGHEDYQIIGTEKRHFDDREILKALLEKQV